MQRLHVGLHRFVREQRRAVAAAFDERHARHHRIAASASSVKARGCFTRPWITSRCFAGSISGAPECEITKCRPLGVNVPLSRWCGVRACWVRGSPLGLLSVRDDVLLEGGREAVSGCRLPGLVLQGSSASCWAATESLSV